MKMQEEVHGFDLKSNTTKSEPNKLIKLIWTRVYYDVWSSETIISTPHYWIIFDRILYISLRYWLKLVQTIKAYQFSIVHLWCELAEHRFSIPFKWQLISITVTIHTLLYSHPSNFRHFHRSWRICFVQPFHLQSVLVDKTKSSQSNTKFRAAFHAQPAKTCFTESPKRFSVNHKNFVSHSEEKNSVTAMSAYLQFCY